uniref:catechol O-methyltransferase n=1 Tax=Sphaeramia orbicularis TaxID=375764 RepID=A0A673BAW1_9TELE
ILVLVLVLILVLVWVLVLLLVLLLLLVLVLSSVCCCSQRCWSCWVCTFCRLLQAVCINAVRGNPDSVIAAIDHFCQNQEWAMNVGDEKGAILDSVVMETSPSTVLELGTYCGYSAVRIMRLLPPATRFITLEMNPDYAAVARQVIQHAGLQDKVCLVEGKSADLIPKMADMFGIRTFDFVFFDHWKDCYLPDIRLLEELLSFTWNFENPQCVSTEITR